MVVRTCNVLVLSSYAEAWAFTEVQGRGSSLKRLWVMYAKVYYYLHVLHP